MSELDILGGSGPSPALQTAEDRRPSLGPWSHQHSLLSVTWPQLPSGQSIGVEAGASRADGGVFIRGSFEKDKAELSLGKTPEGVAQDGWGWPHRTASGPSTS